MDVEKILNWHCRTFNHNGFVETIYSVTISKGSLKNNMIVLMMNVNRGCVF